MFVGRLGGEDALEAERYNVVEGDYLLYVFKPGRYYYSMNAEDYYTSRRHALLELRESRLSIVDHDPYGTESINGTFINGKRIEPAKPYRLSHSDEVSLGFLTKLKRYTGTACP